MLEKMRDRHSLKEIEYRREFSAMKNSNLFSFLCDENGTLLSESESEHARFNDCIKGLVPCIDLGIHKIIKTVFVPALAKCSCGHVIELKDFTNTCVICNRDFNSFGQELASRELWGEESGESLSDILDIGHQIS